MKKIQIIAGAALLAALLLLLGLLIWRCAQPAEEDAANIVVITPTPTEEIPSNIGRQTPMLPLVPLPTGSPAPSESPQATTKASDYFCTLTIKSKEITVFSGVEEEKLKQHPGWLPSSAMPGEDGMCVIYGHRNRTHLRVLEDVKNGDTITVMTADGTGYQYSITDIMTYESTAELRLPAVDGKALVLVTCYPFRYSGSAPGKYVVTARLNK